MKFVYVLYLEDKKVYVGTTTDIDKTLDSQYEGNGVHWTQLHKPLKGMKVDVYPQFGQCEEEKRTIKVM